VENVYYHATAALTLLPLDQWEQRKTSFLKRFLATAYARARKKDRNVAPHDFSPQMRSALVFFGIIHFIYKVIFKGFVFSEASSTWPQKLAEYIRFNDVALLESCDEALNAIQQRLYPAADLAQLLHQSQVFSTGEPSPWPPTASPSEIMTDVLQEMEI
ncbi:unnamed protein product, partial [Cyprideis torosa]